MKNLITAFMLAGSLTSLSAQKKLQDFQLRGKVKSVKEITYKIEADKSERRYQAFEDSTTMEFNNKGLLTKFSNFDEEVIMDSYTTFGYNDKGYITEMNMYNFIGALDEALVFKPEGENRMCSENVCTTMDQNGNIIFQLIYYPEYGFFYAHEYTYDEQNYKLTETYRTKDPTNDKTICGNALKEIDHKKVTASWFQPETISTFTYDESGNMVSKEILYKPENKTETFSYTHEFDAKGNWIKQTVFENELKTKIVERSIEYY